MLVFVCLSAAEDNLTCNYSIRPGNETGISAIGFHFFLSAQCSFVQINLRGKMLSIQTATGKMMSQKSSTNLQ